MKEGLEVKNVEIDSSKLKLAQIRYFDMESKASKLPEENAYVFLIEVDGKYVNVLDSTQELPVFARSPYSNITMDGVEFGNQIYLVNGELKDGPCFIIENINLKHEFKKDKILIKELENYIINSDKFFIDRIKILEKQKKKIKKNLIKQKIENDLESFYKLNAYLSDELSYYQYKK